MRAHEKSITFLIDLSALAMRDLERIKSELTGRVFRSVSHSFCKHAVPLLSTQDLHTYSNEKAHGKVLPLNDGNRSSER